MSMTSDDIAVAVEQVIERWFDGRTGHGGGPCTQRHLSRQQLQTFAIEAIALAEIARKQRETS